MEKFDRIVKAITNKDTEVLEGAIHPDFMLIRENSLVSKDEQLEFLQKMFEGDNEWLDFKYCYEDEDILVWKYLLFIKSEDKKLLVTNHQAFKDNLLLRIMLNAKEVSKELEKIQE